MPNGLEHLVSSSAQVICSTPSHEIDKASHGRPFIHSRSVYTPALFLPTCLPSVDDVAKVSSEPTFPFGKRLRLQETAI
jgi:hypothetical protein